MPSTFFGLNTASSALAAAQLQMETAAHNVANASTEGYSRQRVTLVASDPYTWPSFNRSGMPGQIGTGVTASAISRVRDAFLDSQLRSQTALQGASTARSDFLSQLESVFPEPAESGLGSVISDFWNAWQDVAADPTSTAARAALVEQVDTLASRFNRDASQLQSVIDSVDNLVSQDVDSVNQLAAQIANLNGQIQRVSISGDHPNDLQDQRDLLLDQLSKLTAFTLEPQADGTVRVLLGGTDLVNGDQARTISTTPDANGHLVPTWSWGSPVQLGNGEVRAIMDLRDNELDGYRTRLDDLAKGIADAVNAVHQTGVDQNGNAGLPIFTYSTGREASTLAVNATIKSDPSRIAASVAANTPGDGSVAGRIADLRDATSVPLGVVGTNLVPGTTLSTNGTAIVSGITAGRAKAQAYTLTGAGNTLTLTGADGSTETITVNDMTANATGTIAFDKLGIRLELRAGATGKLASDIVTDLTTAPNNSIAVGSIFSIAQTAADFYADFVGTLGSDTRQATEAATNQGLVVKHLEQRRESMSGVSLDEEATDMIRFQHAYQAAARVITTMDEMLDTLINRVGTVGR